MNCNVCCFRQNAGMCPNDTIGRKVCEANPNGFFVAVYVPGYTI